MSVVICSLAEKTKGTEKGHRVFDHYFYVPNGLLTYETGSYVIVVLESECNKMELILDLLKNNSSFEEKLSQSLKGAFSFLIYDRIIKKVSVFRSITADPIFYHCSHNQLLVSNDLQTMRRWGKDLNEKYFHLYLHTELTETEYTPYKKVYRLLPGYKLTKTSDNYLTTSNFWSACQLESTGETIEDHITTFTNLLTEIVHESIVGHKNIGCEISGGLDSSSISYLADRLCNSDSQMYGYTYIFDQISDGKSNKEKVDFIYRNTRITPEYLGLSNYWSFKDTESKIQYFDEPSALILNFAMFRDLNQTAKDMNIDVLLSGEGGDELLSLSPHYLRDLLFQGHMIQVFTDLMKIATKKRQPVWKVFSTHIFPALLSSRFRYRFESRVNEPTWQNTGFSLNWYHTLPWIGEKLKKVTYDEVELERRKIRNKKIKGIYMRENFERLVLVNPCTWLNRNISRPLGLKRIYPFRDQRLMEFFFSVPFTAKMEMSYKKNCIRKGLENVVPKELLLKPDRSGFVEIFRKGFNKEARFVSELIQTSRTDKMGWIQKDVLQKAVDRFRYGFNHEIGPIARALGLELWLRHHGY